MLAVFKQHLPASYRNILKHIAQSNVYPNEPRIKCDGCGTDLLVAMLGSVAQLQRLGNSPRNGSTIPQLLEVCFACDQCRNTVEQVAMVRHGNGQHGRLVMYWRDISDYCDPATYIKLLREDLKFVAYHQNYFVGDSGIRWMRFFEAMFYYVCRPEPGKKFSKLETHWERFEL